MTRNKILILFFALINLSSFGQSKLSSYDMVWGYAEPGSNKRMFKSIVGYDDYGFYALKANRVLIMGDLARKKRTRSFALDYFNHDLKKARSVEIDLRYFDEDRALEKVMHFNNRLYLFTSSSDKVAKTNRLFVHQIDKKNLRVDKNETKLAVIDYEGFQSDDKGGYGLELSPNESKLLVYSLIPSETGGSKKFNFKVFSGDMKLLWERDISLSYLDKLFEVGQFKISDDGDVYLLGLVYNQNRKKENDGKPNYWYNLMAFQKDSEKVDEFPIKDPDKFINGMEMSINDLGDIICAGFYSGDGTEGIKGTYFLSVDGRSKQVKNRNLQGFSADFIAGGTSHKGVRETRKKGGNVELYNYTLNEFIAKEDGGAFLVAEQSFVFWENQSVRNSDGTMSSRNAEKFVYGDVIVISIDKEGKILWSTRVSKTQSSYNDAGYYASYTLAVQKDKLFVIYNGRPDKLFAETHSKNKKFKKGGFNVIVEIDSEGNQNKSTLISFREIKMIARPKVSTQISENEVIVFCQGKGKHRLTKLLL